MNRSEYNARPFASTGTPSRLPSPQKILPSPKKFSEHPLCDVSTLRNGAPILTAPRLKRLCSVGKRERPDSRAKRGDCQHGMERALEAGRTISECRREGSNAFSRFQRGSGQTAGGAQGRRTRHRYAERRLRTIQRFQSALHHTTQRHLSHREHGEPRPAPREGRNINRKPPQIERRLGLASSHLGYRTLIHNLELRIYDVLCKGLNVWVGYVPGPPFGPCLAVFRNYAKQIAEALEYANLPAACNQDRFSTTATSKSHPDQAKNKGITLTGTAAK